MTINERFAEILKTKNISVKEASVLIRKSEVYVLQVNGEQAKALV